MGIACEIVAVLVLLSVVCARDGYSSKFCTYPCKCAVRELDCVAGVTMVKDGCDCCYMCARQHGDLCNVKDKCDGKHDLYCDMSSQPHGPGTGICRAKSRKPCVIGGHSYPDGEKFRLPNDCSKLCTCQNGNYGCVDLCPDQYRIPSKTHCRRPTLMRVAGQCCKQWTCDTLEQRQISTSGIKPRHLIGPNRNPKAKSSQYRQQPVASAYQNTEPYCPPAEGDWSRCSETCNVGVSTRTITDRNCQTRQETRLCFIRPCNTTLGPPTRFHLDAELASAMFQKCLAKRQEAAVYIRGKRCTPTIRLPHKQRVHYEDCVSVHELNFKVCTNCKSTRCCYPRREKTRHIDFECGDGRRQLFAFMWIKSCRCDRKCYEKDHDDQGWGKETAPRDPRDPRNDMV